ncbi:16S rRNA (cytosine(967)-C(5))-methyltransferase RsmB [Clostridium sp.]|uniref:16S rRNA (cytosine(967)-C(5))-methyltransferase RsmB n=1 Tax=Clostridium sp. TaxID=1506 RepID=UPI0034639945
MKAREVIVKVLDEVFSNNAYSNIVLNSELNKSKLNDKDRGLATEVVYGTIKYKYSIDSILKNFIQKDFSTIQSKVLNILRSSIYQMHYLDKVPDYAVVNEAVDMGKKESEGAGKFVNGVLRSYIRSDKEELLREFNGDIGFLYSYPRWMVNLFTKQYGEYIAKSILKGLNETPYMTVRVNELKGTFDDAFEALEEKGYEVEEGYICPEAIIIKRGKGIEENQAFKEGLITVQDESAMLVAPLMEVKEDEIAMDLCSAPGGKATHMAELMNNKGTVIAQDIHEHKLKLIDENVTRLNLTNIKTVLGDSTKLNTDFINYGDKVLIDVPCSGLGIIRKKPEIKWTKNPRDLREVVKVQRDIMDNAAQYVKSGGILLYSTCTLNKEENENNIDWFLNKHKDFKIEKIYLGDAENIIYSDAGYITVLPNKYMDGFFIAKLRKI